MEKKWVVQQGLFIEQKASESQTKTFNRHWKTYGPQWSKFMTQMVKTLDGSDIKPKTSERNMKTKLWWAQPYLCKPEPKLYDQLIATFVLWKPNELSIDHK